LSPVGLLDAIIFFLKKSSRNMPSLIFAAVDGLPHQRIG